MLKPKSRIDPLVSEGDTLKLLLCGCDLSIFVNSETYLGGGLLYFEVALSDAYRFRIVNSSWELFLLCLTFTPSLRYGSTSYELPAIQNEEVQVKSSASCLKSP